MTWTTENVPATRDDLLDHAISTAHHLSDEKCRLDAYAPHVLTTIPENGPFSKYTLVEFGEISTRLVMLADFIARWLDGEKWASDRYGFPSNGIRDACRRWIDAVEAVAPESVPHYGDPLASFRHDEPLILFRWRMAVPSAMQRLNEASKLLRDTTGDHDCADDDLTGSDTDGPPAALLADVKTASAEAGGGGATRQSPALLKFLWPFKHPVTFATIRQHFQWRGDDISDDGVEKALKRLQACLTFVFSRHRVELVISRKDCNAELRKGTK